MQRQAVVSSNIASIGYDQQTKVLEVEFKSGTVYQYTDVPAVLFDQLVQSPSVGKHFGEHVRSKFASKKVEAAAA
jgi:hypothetical protein